MKQLTRSATLLKLEANQIIAPGDFHSMADDPRGYTFSPVLNKEMHGRTPADFPPSSIFWRVTAIK